VATERVTPPENWLCYYGTAPVPHRYAAFDLIVFDGYYHPPLDFRSDDRPRILGYLSVGEIDGTGPYWDRVKDMACIVRKNSRWNSWIVDVRDPAWQELIFTTFIPSIMDDGFDGLFLDTFDSALALDDVEDIRQSLVSLVKRIGNLFPGLHLAVNRGLPVLPDIAHDIDYLVVEGLSSVYNVTDGAYVTVDGYTQNFLLEQIESGLALRPRLPVLTLDYASQDQADLRTEALSFSRKKGFIPYVGTHNLDEICLR